MGIPILFERNTLKGKKSAYDYEYKFRRFREHSPSFPYLKED
jgi:hypothetical protein